MIHGLTLQKAGKQLDLRCPECTLITGRIGLVREAGPPLKLYCRLHPENYGNGAPPKKWNAKSRL